MPRRPSGLEQFWETLTLSVQGRNGRVLENPTLRPAAVLIPFFEKEGAPFLLLTKRSEGVLRHQGEISFPGGCREPADADLFETALRECREEIGLEPNAVRLIGRLDDHETVSGFSVTPFVARISYPYSFWLDLQEVTALIEVPFYFLTDPDHGRERTILFRGQNRTIRSYLYNGNDIWGATAEIIHGLVSRIQEREQRSGENRETD